MVTVIQQFSAEYRNHPGKAYKPKQPFDQSTQGRLPKPGTAPVLRLLHTPRQTA